MLARCDLLLPGLYLCLPRKSIGLEHAINDGGELATCRVNVFDVTFIASDLCFSFITICLCFGDNSEFRYLMWRLIALLG